MRIPKSREGRMRELRNRLAVTVKIECCKQADSRCERWDKINNADTDQAAYEFYDRGWRVEKLINPPDWKPGTYYLVVCPNCVGRKEG